MASILPRIINTAVDEIQLYDRVLFVFYLHFDMVFIYILFYFILSVYMYSPLNLFGYWTLNKLYY